MVTKPIIKTMIAAVVCLGAIFPDAPLEVEMALGRDMASKIKREGITKHVASLSGHSELVSPEVLFEKSKLPIGTWSDGLRKVSVEWVVPIDASLCSRWMGYLEGRDGWTGGEEHARWNQIKRELEGKRVYVVILSSFPTKPTLGLGEVKRNDPTETTDVKFVFEGPAGKREGMAEMFAFARTRGKGELDLVPWWQRTPIGQCLRPMFEPVYEPPMLQRGDYQRAFWWVWTGDDMGDGPVTLKVLSRRKIRSATFEGAKTGT